MSTPFARKAELFKAKMAETRAVRVRQAQLQAMPPRPRNRCSLQHQIATARNWPRKPNPTLCRERPAGWLLPCLLQIDDALWGRWDYWAQTMWAGKLLDEPLPQIDFTQEGVPQTGYARRMLAAALNSIPRHGEWRTWGSWQYLDYFFDWLLYGFGQLKQLPPEPETGAFSRLYQVFCLEAMLAWPRDYFGDLMAEQQHGRHLGFYPTPHNLVEFMVRMNMGGAPNERDPRTLSVCDPCVGTGRMLLHASNYSMRLYGHDINATCVKACTVNLWLYAPWGARPIPFLESI